MSRQFQSATQVRTGLGSLEETATVCEEMGVRRVAVIADGGLDAGGILDDFIERMGIGPFIVERILAGVNPSPESVVATATRVRESGADAVLGIGGGSGLCAAKAAALLATNRTSVSTLEGVDRASVPPLPVVAVPTTAGSGSEVSNALVLHEAGRVREIVIRGRGYEPSVAILDATVLRGLPRTPLVYAALDALTHSLEAMWARGRSSFTDACAISAAETILTALPLAADGAADGSNREGTNDTSLQELLEASALANIACGNSGLGLVHALSSSPRVGLAHGLQNGILLPYVARFNSTVLGQQSLDLVQRLPLLYERIGFTATFEPGTADAERMIEASRGHAFRDNNLRPTGDEQLAQILSAAGAGGRTDTETHTSTGRPA